MPKGVHSGPRGRKYESLQDRFNSRYEVDEQTGCWNWTGATNNYGYGMLRPPGEPMKLAHRVSWEMKNGPIPEGRRIGPTCQNASCVNPEHWTLKTKANTDLFGEPNPASPRKPRKLRHRATKVAVVVDPAQEAFFRKCVRCGAPKTASDFRGKSTGRINRTCNVCADYKVKEWKGYSPEKLERYYEKQRQRFQALRQQVLEHYGTSCACCGESDWRFLVIDHVDGGGNKHRRANGISGGTSFNVWLRRNGFPYGFQTLCHNCNFAKGTLDHCPHQDEDLTARIGACG